MSLKKKLFGAPATVLGITLGLVIGGLEAAKEMIQKRSPKVGLTIILVSPVLTFLFEQIMSRAFPEQYWEKLAGKLVKLYRYIINEDFQLSFLYELRFLVTPTTPEPITAEMICESLNDKPGGDPEPAFVGLNYVHFRFSGAPFLVSLQWDLEEPDDDATESAMTVIRIKMEPETRNMTMRRAQGEIEGIIARLNRFQQSLASLFDAPIKTLATADAWFDETKPAATPIPKAREDKISGARYRTFPGLLHVSGKDLATLGAVYRYVGTLQPAADPE